MRVENVKEVENNKGLNPYYTGSNSMRNNDARIYGRRRSSLNPYYTGSNSMRRNVLQIYKVRKCLNPYYTGSNSMSI